MNNKRVDIVKLCYNIMLSAKGGDIDQALISMKRHLLEYTNKHDGSYYEACGYYAGLKIAKLHKDPSYDQNIKTLGDLRRAVERELAA